MGDGQKGHNAPIRVEEGKGLRTNNWLPDSQNDKVHLYICTFVQSTFVQSTFIYRSMYRASPPDPT